MSWYWFFLLIWVVAYILFLVVVKLSVREKKDSAFKEKMDKLRVKLDPRITFFENLFTWVFVLGLIFVIYIW
jgi:uncharacterized membrane protein